VGLLKKTEEAATDLSTKFLESEALGYERIWVREFFFPILLC